MEPILNSPLFWIVTFYVIATAAFVPFVREITKKSIVQCIGYCLLVQGISMLAYAGVFFATAAVIWHPPVAPSMRSIHALLPPLFLATLLVVPPLSTLIAKLVMSIKTAHHTRVILGGNLLVFGILWFCLWLAPF
jgi:hypothetical protein